VNECALEIRRLRKTRRALSRLGCDVAQGAWAGRPLPADELAANEFGVDYSRRARITRCGG
jgi:predicted signal transduction protein with EAL and GGDEF domain